MAMRAAKCIIVGVIGLTACASNPKARVIGTCPAKQVVWLQCLDTRDGPLQQCEVVGDIEQDCGFAEIAIEFGNARVRRDDSSRGEPPTWIRFQVEVSNLGTVKLYP